MKAKNQKKHKCKVCDADYVKQKMGQKVCSPKCAIDFAKKEQSITVTEKAKEWRKDKRIFKLNDKSVQLELAQKAFNLYIRLRDYGKQCITCPVELLPSGLQGGYYDAGHFRPRGMNSKHRFNEMNVHGQCKRCNRQLSGNIKVFEDVLRQRFGGEKIDELINDNEPYSWALEELWAIKKEYSAKARELKKQKGL